MTDSAYERFETDGLLTFRDIVTRMVEEIAKRDDPRSIHEQALEMTDLLTNRIMRNPRLIGLFLRERAADADSIAHPG